MESTPQPSIFADMVDRLRFKSEAELRMLYLKFFSEDLKEEWKDINKDAEFKGDSEEDDTIRHKLYNYISIADDKKLRAIYDILGNEIGEANEWWKDKIFLSELDHRSKALEEGTDKGFTVEQMETSINKLRKKRYGK